MTRHPGGIGPMAQVFAKVLPPKADMLTRKRVFMFGCFHHLLPAMTGVLGVATVWADGGYLPSAGPLPLRFRVPCAPIVSQVNNSFPPPFLPPLFPPPPGSAPISLTTPPIPASAPDNAIAAKGPAAPGTATNGLALGSDARRFVTGPASATAPDALVSPQMLLKYFTNSASASGNVATNATSLGVIAPLGFTPPPVPTAAPTPPPIGKPTSSTSP